MYLGQNIKQILPGNVAVGGANMGMVPLFSVMWCPSRDAIWAGYVAADGQELDDNLFPDAAAGIAANNVPTTSNANWLSDPTARGAYVAGSSAGKFRVPDYNGKFDGSLGAVFLRGDGALSGLTDGLLQRDALQGHAHSGVVRNNGGSVWPDGGGVLNYAGTSAGVVTDAAFGDARVAAETRPLNVTGCWVIKLFGAVTNMASADAAQLASSYASLGARINALPFTKEYVSTPQPVVSGGLVTVNHGFGSRPKIVKVSYVVVSAFSGYSIGEEIDPDGAGYYATGGTTYGKSITSTTTQILVRNAQGFLLLDKNTGAVSQPAASSLNLIVRAWA